MSKALYINYHAHIPMAFWLGLGSTPGIHWVESWWTRMIEPVEKLLRPEDISALAEMSALFYRDAGISEVWDMYFHEAETAAQMAKHGLKVYAGEAVMTNPPSGFAKYEAIRETARLREVFASEPLVEVVMAYIGPYAWASDEEMSRACAKLAQELGLRVHTHGAGELGDYQACRELYGVGPVEALQRFGFFDASIPEVVIAHCGYLDDRELEILQEVRQKVVVALCPRAARNLEYGKCPVQELIRRGVKVGLGTDGGSPSGVPDMEEEIRVAAVNYGVPEDYFREINSSRLKPSPVVSEAERLRIIRSWISCLRGIAERSALAPELREHLLSNALSVLPETLRRDFGTERQRGIQL